MPVISRRLLLLPKPFHGSPLPQRGSINDFLADIRRFFFAMPRAFDASIFLIYLLNLRYAAVIIDAFRRRFFLHFGLLGSRRFMRGISHFEKWAMHY